MNKRERMLTIVVVVVLLAVVFQFGIDRVRKGFKLKNDRIALLEDEIDKKKKSIRYGMNARENMEKIVPQSLPKDSEKAIAVYREWLDRLIADAGLQAPENTFIKQSQEKDVYQLYQFKISGFTKLPSLVSLLYRFNEKNYLHRIRSLTVTPDRREMYLLKVDMDVDVLGLEAAKPDQPAPSGSSNRLSLSLAEYTSRIVNRNLFAPANLPPKLSSESKVSVAVDSRLDYRVSASDPDAGQQIEYRLVGDVPNNLSIDKRTGQLIWQPRQLGTYRVTVEAKDNGLPSQAAQQVVAIQVVDAPKPIVVKEPPKFDIASQAFVSAFVTSRNGQPEVWIRSKIEDKTVQLKVGDPFSVGELKGKVTAIGVTYAEFETDGRRWIVGMDESLADAYKRSSID